MIFFRRRKVDIPSASDPIWEDLVTKRQTLVLGTLGAKVLLVKLGIRIKSAENEKAAVEESAKEYRNYFVQNSRNPNVRRDIDKIKKLMEAVN